MVLSIFADKFSLVVEDAVFDWTVRLIPENIHTIKDPSIRQPARQTSNLVKDVPQQKHEGVWCMTNRAVQHMESRQRQRVDRTKFSESSGREKIHSQEAGGVVYYLTVSKKSMKEKWVMRAGIDSLTWVNISLLHQLSFSSMSCQWLSAIGLIGGFLMVFTRCN